MKTNDGGRQAAGWRGKAGDCATRAIAIVTGKPYQEVYDAINALAKKERIGKHKRKSSARNGISKAIWKPYIESLGYTWTPTMKVGQGCKVHLRKEELPSGRLIVRVSGHLVAVIDGEIQDTHDSSRDGTRCVYGFFSKQNIIQEKTPEEKTLVGEARKEFGVAYDKLYGLMEQSTRAMYKAGCRIFTTTCPLRWDIVNRLEEEFYGEEARQCQLVEK